ncbi:MAG: septum site-determining protein MinC [Deltaproteobacteria bacterium]|nr:septum site-determining protein MinC [Deltaproteobacteria bacterium]MBW2068543.1 septum site-determining protein MinC [Deltaproteobacteria bacterium]
MNLERGVAPVQIRAQRDGQFLFLIDSSMPFQMILRYLEKKHKSSKGFFVSAKIILDLGNRPFRFEEVKALRDMLRHNWGASVVELRLGQHLDSFFDWASKQIDIPIRQIPVGENLMEPVVVRQTCRSGVRVEAPMDCIILGDVNPGAEVIAGRDIIVFGVLRGIAHAGAMGNRDAKIWALSIEPNQIRIADLVAVPPQEDRHKPKKYEVAQIKEGRIQVLTF